MQAAGCQEEIQNSFEKAKHAFQDVFFPASKQVLLTKAIEYNVRAEVLQVIESFPDGEYNSDTDAIEELESDLNIVQPFICLEYPVTKEKLLEAARNFDSSNEVTVALENCPYILYKSFGDVIQICSGITNW